ncbi:(p)ppGpp synthetase I SpoT/RelA [Idiomarina aquatica]|uniref:GTP pyrophosphokinase n=1 Tax=Idiomarina aquatica TaxID=1327752 RepID=A0A4R6PQB0_9GAMM|nr:GTP diphosphokinase [Idiomarina aquatica]TDP40506.1 (p)ppGpp synthetase I SpoT/RelA [Idiomarina aquatica]
MVHVRSTHVDDPNYNDDQQHWLHDVAQPEVVKQHAAELAKAHPKHAQALLKGKEMVEILAPLNLDTESLVASLYAPLIEAGAINLDKLPDDTSKTLRVLLQNVHQMQSISDLQHFQHGQPDGNQIDNVRRMLLSMVEDVRAVLIKLAERICYLREVKNADEETRVLAAKECAEIYAPLANRLGIGQLKWELEDISFRYLHPQTYKALAKQLDERRLDRENYISAFVEELQQLLREQDIDAEVYGRPKHIYSIWRKMQKKHLQFDQLFDIRAVRILTDSLKDCYGALGVVHTRWRHLASEFDDYVATPKPNGYQSIHTVVVGPDNKNVEIQIRSHDMHDDAELGVAAHWMYKEGASAGKRHGFEEKISWLRKLLAWHEDMAGSDSLVDEIRSQVFEDRVYVFTPKGEVVDLPAGSTPLDFAYYIHSQVGHRCVGAKVDGRIVPFTYQLQNGNRVEILTQKTAKPRRDWLNPQMGYLHSARARAKVHTYFKKQDRDKNIIAGRELLENELHKHNLPLSKASDALERFNVSSLDDLLAAIGAGDVRLHQVVNFLKPQTSDAEKVEQLKKRAKVNKRKVGGTSEVVVEGIGNLMMQFAKCCEPLPGEPIMGFITQGRGVSVHRRDCEQLANLLHQHPQRAIEVNWSRETKQDYRAGIRISALDRNSLLHDITSVLSNEKAAVLQMDSDADGTSQTATIVLQVAVKDSESLQRISQRLRQINGVEQVQRV